MKFQPRRQASSSPKLRNAINGRVMPRGYAEYLSPPSWWQLDACGQAGRAGATGTRIADRRTMSAESGFVSERAQPGTAWRVLVGTGLVIGVALSGCGEKAEGVAVSADHDTKPNAGPDVADETGSTVTGTVDGGPLAPSAKAQLYLAGVTLQDGQYVATGALEGDEGDDKTESVILTSQDAEVWSVRYRGGNEVLAAVAFGGGHWVAAGWGIHQVGTGEFVRSRSILFSEDAATWQEVAAPEAKGFHEVVWAGTEFLMRGEVEGGYALWASETGAEWTERGRGDVPIGLTVGVPGVAGYGTKAISLTGDAGLSWSRSILEEKRWVRGLWAEGDGFAGTAWYDCCAGHFADRFEYYAMHSPDGLAWSLQRTYDPVPIAAARIGERWVGLSVSRGALLYRDAKESWQESNQTSMEAVTAGNKFVAVGLGIWNSEDGKTWVPATVPTLDW
jgi:hypothetical protein